MKRKTSLGNREFWKTSEKALGRFKGQRGPHLSLKWPHYNLRGHC